MAEHVRRGALTRRRFLREGAVALGGAAAAPAFLQSLLACDLRAAGASPVESPYGPLAPVADLTTGLPLLRLPPGFQYRSMSWAGDLLDDGTPTPGAHDGMAVVAMRGNRTRDLVLIRNHEVALGPLLGAGTTAPVYDPVVLDPGLADLIANLLGLGDATPTLGGGTTRLTVRRGELAGAVPALAGTVANCAGGPTPWGSWLSCEEVMVDGTGFGAKKHGFVFEVPASGTASAVPITDMGFFPHEAAAVDPRTGIVYLTEDNGPESGFYRFLPRDPTPRLGALEAGGTLEMLAVQGAPRTDLRDPLQGESFDVTWVPIAEPDANPPSGSVFFLDASGPLLKGKEAGAAFFRRLEGCWYAEGRIFFVDTSGGAAGEGVVWSYEPSASDPAAGGRLTARFVSTSPLAGNNADNLTVSPRGGIVVCEEGGAFSRLMGITADGESYAFAENHVVIDAPLPGRPHFPVGDHSASEWAGATFDPTGRILFANVQFPGITFAISGPWHRGPL